MDLLQALTGGGAALGSGGRGLRAAGAEVRVPLALAAIRVSLLLARFGTLPGHAAGRLVSHHFWRGSAEGRQPLAFVALVESGALFGVADGGRGGVLGDAASVRVEVFLSGLAPGFA